MSFIRTLSARALPLVRTSYFSTSPYVSRSVIEGTKDALEATNRTIANAAVKGIEKGGQLCGFSFI